MYNPNNRIHTIFINPIIATPNVIQAVKDRFNLSGEVKITKDNSGEFDCIAFDADYDPI